MTNKLKRHAAPSRIMDIEPGLTFQQLYSERHESTLSSGQLDTLDSWRFCHLYLHRDIRVKLVLYSHIWSFSLIITFQKREIILAAIYYRSTTLLNIANVVWKTYLQF